MMKSSTRPGGGAPTPSSVKQRRSRAPKENVDPDSLQPPPESSPFRPPSAVAKPLAVHNRSPLPPRPLKRKLSSEPLPEIGAPQASVAPDSGVQVIVRIRPPRKEEDEGDRFVRRISSDSISVADQSFTFDSVADTGSTQHDIFQLVGLPLVENCLAGFNSSIFAYGQTGSGKTYTMWGPISALSVEESSTEWGLTPRIFQRLFTRINEEQSKHSDKRLSYQCCCSFLEIYNEQITDLLDSAQKNLQIREDVKTGVYVDYLTEEYVSSVKDVVQLLIKGLANRRTGATCANAESSRSHCVFTCVVESRSKSVADGLSSVRTSKINLVDLAGSERQKLTTAEGERLKEAGNINRSLSQLGNLINILAEVSLSRKQRHIPYRDSKLTFLLQDSLGGNAKLAMICAISASQCCQNETFSTLRFAQRAKAIKNKAIVNEITQDDVNILREQIRQLKDELLRMKSTGSSGESNGSCSTGWNARRSLNLLRQSLNCPAALSVFEGDSDEEMEIDQEDLERSCIQADAMSTSCEESKPEVQNVHSEYPNEVKSSCSDSKMVPENLHPVFTTRSGCGGDRAFGSTNVINESCRFVEVGQVQVSVEGCELVGTSKVQICPESNEKEASYRDDGEDIIMLTDDKSLDSGSTLLISGEENLVFVTGDSHSEEKGLEGKASVIKSSLVGSDSVKSLLKDQPRSSAPADTILPSNFSIGPQQISACLHSPTLNTSPRVENYSRKSLRSSISTSASQTNKVMNVDSNSGVLNLCFADALAITPSSSSAPNLSSLPPTEHLEASLLHGLQVIDSHQHNSALRRSSFSFPVKSVDLKPLVPVNRVNVGIQTSSEKSDTLEESAFVCNRCKNYAPPLDYMDAKTDMDFQLRPTNGSQLVDKYKKHVPKAVEKVLAGAIRREMALQDHSAKQAAEILQLNQLIQQYKHGRECNAILEQTREDKINRLEGLMDGILPTEEFMEEEFISLRNEHNLLKEKYENHPDILRLNIELNKVQNELDEYRNFHDMGERDVLMEEIQDLRNQLQFYVASSHMPTQRQSPCHKLTGINGNNLSAAKKSELTEEYVNEKFEEERCHWTETESRWISLSEELRLELESSQSLAKKWKNELDSEKKCTEELKEALQMAMQGHARLLDQYADLQEKHIVLLARHRKISDGIQDVKKAAAKAGIKGAAYRFIKSLAAEISAIKVEKEKERQHLRGENKRLQAQVRDTAEAVQAAGELLVRLKEAEEAATLSQRRALEAEQKAEKAYEEIDMLKKNHERKICMLNQFLAESCLPKEALRPASSDDNVVKYGGESLNEIQRGWEFEHSYQENKEFSGHSEPCSWFPGHDQCNI